MASNTPVSRRKVLQTASFVGLGGLAGIGRVSANNLQGTPTPTATPEPFNGVAGSVGTSLGDIPFLTAIVDMLPEATDGRFTAENRQFSSGRLELQALISGSIDMFTGGVGSTYQAYVAGADLRIIMPVLVGTDYVIAIREDVPDLAALTEPGNDYQFGISSIGALSHTQAVGMLIAEDLDPSNVNWVEIGGSSSRTAAIASGNIDATPIHIGQLERIQSEGAAVKNAGELAEHYPNFIQSTVAVRSRDLDRHPAFFQAVCNQAAVAYQRAMNDFEWVFQNTQKFQAEPLDREEARTTWELNRDLNAWPTEPIGREPYQNVFDMMREAGVLEVESIDFDTLIDTTYSERAYANL